MKEIDARQATISQLLRTDVCALFYRFAQELPGQQILLNLGREKLLICQDCDSAHRVLRENPGNFHKNFAAFTTYFGSSRLTADGEQWRKLQRIGQPLIAHVETPELNRATQIHYARAAAQLSKAASMSPIVTIDPFMDHAAASVVMHTVLGLDISDLSSQFYLDLRTVLNFCGEASMKVYDPSLKIEAAETIGLENAYRAVREVVGQLIVKAKKAGRGHAHLDQFYAAYESDIDLFGEFSTLLFAGFDTTSSTLCWALMLLANKPLLQKQLREELLALTEGGELTSDVALSSETMTALLNETFRMFPAVPILSRIAVEDDRIGASEVQAGQKILLSIIGLHHDSRFWKSPSRMDIGRFRGRETDIELRQHFYPFSAGPRMCGGSKFAMTELAGALFILLRDLQFDAVDKQPVRFQWGASMRHRDGVRLAVSHAP